MKHLKLLQRGERRKATRGKLVLTARDYFDEIMTALGYRDVDGGEDGYGIE